MNKENEIAIIGMACKFPGADNYLEYWQNLINGINSVSEIPSDRWNYSTYSSSSLHKENTTDIKWGGFIKNVDKFDPLFFKISPTEANYMDPQHRLLLETAWHAVEDAGYNPNSLAGKNIGVYVGVSKNDYAEMMRENKTPIISFVSTGTVHSIIANRISYLFDFTGKSEAVDTACSSFMTALDHAVRDIQLGLCESALVGGVNAILTPTMYISHTKSGMLSPDGVCRTFDENANGYVRGEGVGVVYLKPLKKALHDRDHIWGLIKGIAVFHGGKANFLTAPKVVSQAAVINTAIKNANIDPASVSYVEAHGTATPLGDPVEIEALKQAYKTKNKKNNKTCGIGSVKTNIGHLESAAGVAGLIKILLAFKFKTIPTSIHFNKLNPLIKLKDSSFYIVQANVDWKNNKSGDQTPLRAGLSSFGMGGVNAHAIVEEPPAFNRTLAVRENVFIPLSAKTDSQLKEYVSLLLDYLKFNPIINSQDISFTLQNGREAMESRVLFVADHIESLKISLQDYLDDNKNSNILVANISYEECILNQMNSQQIEMSKKWLQGENINWDLLHVTENSFRVNLPGYPFAKIHCWFPKNSSQDINMNPSNLEKTRVQFNGAKNITFTINDYFIKDHIVQNNCLIPGVKYLDIFFTEAEKQNGLSVNEIQTTSWMRPIQVIDSVEVEIDYSKFTSKNNYEMFIKKGELIYSQAKIIFGERKKLTKKLNINLIDERCKQKQSAVNLYVIFNDNGLNYGNTFKVIKNCRYNENEIICELQRNSLFIIDKKKILEPSMMDGVFQSVTAHYLLNNFIKAGQLVPYHLGSIKIYDGIPDKCFVYAKRNTKDGNNESYDMLIVNETGEVLIEFKEFIKRYYESTIGKDIMSKELLTFTTQWIPRKLGMHSEPLSVMLIFTDEKLLRTAVQNQLQDRMLIYVEKGKTFKVIGHHHYVVNPLEVDSFTQLWNNLNDNNIKIDGIIYHWYFFEKKLTNKSLTFTVDVIFLIIKTLILSKNTNALQFIYLYHVNFLFSSMHAMIAGFARTLAYENPNFKIRTVGVDSTDIPFLAKIACQELAFYNNAPLYEIKYQENIRLAKVIIPIDQDSTTNEILIRQHGCYLIVGGCGGLGFIFASYLAKNYQANLILVGHTKINDEINEKLKQLKMLSGKAEYFDLDITDSKAVNQFHLALMKKNRKINGIVYCAGRIDDAFIVRKARESFKKVISVKVNGVFLLDEVTKNIRIDFFIVFSSIAAIMPNQGQCDYAAANSFLDEFVKYRNHLVKEKKRFGHSISINWPLWKNGGISVNEEEKKYLKNIFGMMPLENEMGIDLFVRTLSDISENFIEQIIAINGEKNKIEKHLQPFSDLSKDCLNISGKFKSLVNQIHPSEKLIELNTSFSDLGINSVDFVKLSQLVNKQFHLEVEPITFFEFNTIEKFLIYLQSQKPDTKEFFANTPETLAENYIVHHGLVDLEKSSIEGLVFVKEFSDQEFFMRDHIVDGKYNVPGACYIEMAIECGEIIAPTSHVYKLTNNYWVKQLSTSGEVILATLKLVNKGEFYEYEIMSNSLETAQLHALGQLYVNNNLTALDLGVLDLNQIHNRCQYKREFEEIYQFIHAEGLHVGMSFMPMVEIVFNQEEALSHLKLPACVSPTSSDYVFHPSLLTGILQTALLNNKPHGKDNIQFIPIGIDEIVFKDIIPQECYVYTKLTPLQKNSNKVVKFDAQVANLEGEIIVQIRGLTLCNLTSNLNRNLLTESNDLSNSDHFTVQVENFLKDCLSPSISLPSSEISSEIEFDHYGINSIMIVELNQVFGDIFGNLSKTLFFEYRSIKELAQYFISNHQPILKSILMVETQNVTPEDDLLSTHIQNNKAPNNEDIFIKQDKMEALIDNKNEDIAIIALAGRYPQANTMQEFWQNMQQAKDCITVMEPWRFNGEKFFETSQDPVFLAAKWGGFLEDIDKFDPQFFNISPREAALMDPQERLFLEVAWETIENAGYTPESLKGKLIGVFLGALWQPYISLAVEHLSAENCQIPSGLLYSIANRVSFYFDWSGPSLAIDTACSSSLTAIHFACESVKRGECESALVGGVNLCFSASKYLWLAKNNFLSSDGRCKSFAEGGDGYVPGEGVGAILIKKLSAAIRDQDNILGVIKSTSVNHGGRTHGYTVPNPNRQAELILSSITKANIDAEKITYIEAHGTGTALGDPIEITAIEKAFSKHTEKKQFCAIGSVKSNIGHLEAAAGIAGLTKILLQMKYQQLVPSIHTSTLNSNINFKNSCLKVQTENIAWPRIQSKDGGTLPYYAMLSSFGAGGSNANLIIEEYRTSNHFDGLNSIDEFILPVSAFDNDRLIIYVKKILDFLENTINYEIVSRVYPDDTLYLRDLTYTFQVARQEMKHRLAIIFKTLEELKTKLKSYLLTYDKKIDGIYVGSKEITSSSRLLTLDNELRIIYDNWTINKKYSKIAELWTNGISINWNLLYSDKSAKRIEIPNYPFKKERFWLKFSENINTVPLNDFNIQFKEERLHPLLHKNNSDLYSQQYKSVFTTDDRFLVNSTIDSIYLPDMVSLEIIREAIYQATGKQHVCCDIIDIEWKSSLLVDAHRIELDTHVGIINYESDKIKQIGIKIYSNSTSDPNNKHLYLEGKASLSHQSVLGELNIEALKAKFNEKYFTREKCYQDLLAYGMRYGNEYQWLEKLYLAKDRLLANIALPQKYVINDDAFVLNPGLLEAIIQSIKLFILKDHTNLSCLDFDLKTIKEISFLPKFSVNLWCYIEANTTTNSSNILENHLEFNAYICNDKDYICLKLLGFKIATKKEFSNKKNDLMELVSSFPTTKKESVNMIELADIQLNEKSSSSQKNQFDFRKIDLSPTISDKLELIDIKNQSNSTDEIIEFLVSSLAKELYVKTSEIDIEKPFIHLGLDSIIGIQWIKEINKKYHTSIPAVKIYDYPNIVEFAAYLLQLLNLSQEFPVKNSNTTQTFEATLLLNESHKIGSSEPILNDIQNFLKASLAACLYVPPGEIDMSRTFIQMGLDSIIGVEWIHKINKKYNCTINATKIYDFPTIQEFSIFLIDLMNMEKNENQVVLESVG